MSSFLLVLTDVKISIFELVINNYLVYEFSFCGMLLLYEYELFFFYKVDFVYSFNFPVNTGCVVFFSFGYMILL
ncbi:hypothetical protein, partial [Klebsiella pneumoniae]|uniref:hypothetical protein n=1 Tax=Klebsiella pneumoniae TaxID=573 RepID=UPI0039C18F9A